MLTALHIEGFKGFGNRQRIELAPLTLLVGRGDTGKSTILHALLYLYELLEHGNAEVDRTALGGDVVELGGFERLVHRHDARRAVVLRAEIALSGLEHFKAVVRPVRSDDTHAPHCSEEVASPGRTPFVRARFVLGGVGHVVHATLKFGGLAAGANRAGRAATVRPLDDTARWARSTARARRRGEYESALLLESAVRMNHSKHRMKSCGGVIIALIMAGVLAPTTARAAINLHQEVFYEAGLRLALAGTLTGCGQAGVTLYLSAQANATTTCTSLEGNQIPGQNIKNITVTGVRAIPGSEIENGTVTFALSTAAPGRVVPGAPGCPNERWLETYDDLEYTSATLEVVSAELGLLSKYEYYGDATPIVRGSSR